MECFDQAALATFRSQGNQIDHDYIYTDTSLLRQRLTFGILVQLGSTVGAEHFDCPVWELLGRLGHADNCQPAGVGSEVACVQCMLFAVRPLLQRHLKEKMASKFTNAWIGNSLWRMLTCDAVASGACYMMCMAPEPAVDAMLQLISAAEPWPDVQ